MLSGKDSDSEWQQTETAADASGIQTVDCDTASLSASREARDITANHPHLITCTGVWNKREPEIAREEGRRE